MLVTGDFVRRCSDAESGSDWAVEEKEAEDAVPGTGIGFDRQVFDVLPERRNDAPWTEFEQVSDHGGAARAALEPD